MPTDTITFEAKNIDPADPVPPDRREEIRSLLTNAKKKFRTRLMLAGDDKRAYCTIETENGIQKKLIIEGPPGGNAVSLLESYLDKCGFPPKKFIEISSAKMTHDEYKNFFSNMKIDDFIKYLGFVLDNFIFQEKEIYYIDFELIDNNLVLIMACLSKAFEATHYIKWTGIEEYQRAVSDDVLNAWKIISIIYKKYNIDTHKKIELMISMEQERAKIYGISSPLYDIMKHENLFLDV